MNRDNEGSSQDPRGGAETTRDDVDLVRREALQRIGQFGIAYTAPTLLAMLAADRAVAQQGSGVN